MQPKSVTMCSLDALKIDLKGLKAEENLLDFDLTDSFFQALDGSQLEHGALHVSVSIRKMAGFFELLFHTEGEVTVSCDRCLEDMQQPIIADNRLMVKLGDTYSEEDDTVTIDENEGMLDMSWFIYEFIMLAIPIKHVHAPGKCNSVMTQKLEELSGAVRSSEEDRIMAHPKRRQSNTRTAKRRTHDKAVAPTLAVCPNCGAYHIYHTVCPTCGYYRGKIAIVMDEAAE